MKKMPIRHKQIAKAKHMLYRSCEKNKHDYFDIIKEELPPMFANVINAFADLGVAAEYAGMAIANLVPNIGKRG
jgi:hypothetical protein